jgi:hypothetical protein
VIESCRERARLVARAVLTMKVLDTDARPSDLGDDLCSR